MGIRMKKPVIRFTGKSTRVACYYCGDSRDYLCDLFVGRRKVATERVTHLTEMGSVGTAAAFDRVARIATGAALSWGSELHPDNVSFDDTGNVVVHRAKQKKC